MDVILGHHAHLLKGVEIYKAKPTFYSLCNFALDVPLTPAMVESKAFREIQSLNPDWRPDTSCTCTFPSDSQMTVVVRIVIRDARVYEVSLVLTFINLQSQPRILASDDPNSPMSCPTSPRHRQRQASIPRSLSTRPKFA